MSEIKIMVGGGAGAAEEAGARAFVAAWHRAERGEALQERQLAFESWEALSRVLTAKRIELLRHVRRHPEASIRALAKALGRDYSNVHTDLRALARAGLVDAGRQGIRADYDVIETRVVI